MIATIPGLMFLALVVTLPIGFAFAACALYVRRHDGARALALLTGAVNVAVIMVAAIVREGVVVMGAGAALLGFLASAAVVNALTPSGEFHHRPSFSQEDWQGEAGIAGAAFAITTVIAFAAIITIVK